MKDIGVVAGREILFSHIVDIPSTSMHHLHLHDYVEIYVYVSGEIDFLLDNECIRLQRGDVVLAHENVLHKPLVRSRVPYERFFIGLPADAFSYMDHSADPLAFLHKGGSLLKLNETQYQELLQGLRQISHDIEQEEPHYVLCAGLMRVLRILNMAEPGGPCRQAGSNAEQLVADVLAYLELYADEVGTVHSIADMFHVNASYLSTTFHDRMGVTLKQYITAKKIAVAKNMLAAGKTVSDAAFACGFSTTSHFISVFRRLTGITPNVYRLSKTEETKG